MNKIEPFEYLANISKGYQEAQILFTGVRLGIFSALDGPSLSPDELSGAIGASRRGTVILCDALTSLGLLHKKDGRYTLNPEYRGLLSPQSPDHYLGMLQHRAYLYETWGKLYEAVKSGRAVQEDNRGSPSTTEFAYAMKDAARYMADKVAGLLDLSDASSLLDVGGGPGMYAIEFARVQPKLKVTILDNEKALEVARSEVEKAGFQDRIDFFAGDIFERRPENRFDVVFASNLVHAYSHEENLELVRNCAGLLKPGGKAVIKDFVLAPDRTQPQGAAIFAVNMLVNTDSGNCYTAAEFEDWFRQAGLRGLRWIEIDAGNCMLAGRR